MCAIIENKLYLYVPIEKYVIILIFFDYYYYLFYYKNVNDIYFWCLKKNC